MLSQASVLPLPPEIWLSIADLLVSSITDILSLTKTCKSMYNLCNPVLYRCAASSSQCSRRALFWGVMMRFPHTVLSALNAGISPNIIATHSSHMFSHSSQTCACSEYFDCGYSLQGGSGNWGPLHVAALNGDVHILEILLEHNADADAGSSGVFHCNKPMITIDRRPHFFRMLGDHWPEPLWTPLHLAIHSDNLLAAEFLLLKGASPIMDIAAQLRILHVACMANQASLLKWAIEGGYDTKVNAVDCRGQTPMDYAILYRNWDCFQTMISYGADVNFVVVPKNLEVDIQDQVLQTMLWDAIASGRFKDALDLLDTEVIPDLANCKDQIPILNLLCQVPWIDNDSWVWERPVGEKRPSTHSDFRKKQAYALELTKRLINFGLNTQEIYQHYTPLSAAAESGNMVAAKYLINLGASVDGRQDLVFTPLERACTSSRASISMVSFLLDSGAALNRHDEAVCPPLWTKEPNHVTDCVQKEMIINLLMENGSNVLRGTSCGDSNFYTPLECRLLRREFEGFKSLLARCPPGRIGKDDLMGFWRARPHDGLFPEITEFILDLDISGVISREDSSALATEISKITEGNENEIRNSIVMKLINQRAPLVEAAPVAGQTPLRTAVMHGVSPNIVKHLLTQGADPYEKKENEMTILGSVLVRKSASQENRIAYTRYLLDVGVSIYEDAGAYTPDSWLNEPMLVIPYINYGSRYRVGESSRNFQALNAHLPGASQTAETGRTHLHVAITQGKINSDIVDLMLEHQPLRDRAHQDIQDYLQLAIRDCNLRALQAIIKSTPSALFLVQKHANQFTHELLDCDMNPKTSHEAIEAANSCIDCLELISSKGEVDWLCISQNNRTDGRTAREKLWAIMEMDTSQQGSSYLATLSRSCRDRIQFASIDSRPKFVDSSLRPLTHK